MIEDTITPDDVRDWQKNEVTQAFFVELNRHIEDADKQVHLLLQENEQFQAALSNAGKVQLEEVLDIPDRMVYEMKEEG